MTARRVVQLCFGYGPLLVVLVLWAIATGSCVWGATFETDPVLRYQTVTGSVGITLFCMWEAWLIMSLPRTRPFHALVPPRLFWTLGLISLFIHIVIAMGVAHHWSHAAAVEHVRQVGGYGGGIIVNYLFAAVWCADVIWWWAKPSSHAVRPRWVGWAIHGFLIFVVLNATVVFGAVERRPIYWLVICLTVLWWLIVPRAIGWLQSQLGRKQEPGQGPGSGDAALPTDHSPT